MDCKNKHINAFVDDSAALLKPDRIVWIDGSQAQIDQLREEACATGEMVKLNQ